MVLRWIEINAAIIFAMDATRNNGNGLVGHFIHLEQQDMRTSLTGRKLDAKHLGPFFGLGRV